MTAQIKIAEAKAKLSSLPDRALAGEEMVIARAGKPLARLDPEDLDAAEGKYADEFGISRPRPERS